MGKARWWVCSDCRSLNDLPASKCYKCRSERPARPALIDDQYGEVSSGQARVSITVDLDRLAELTSPDPLETAKGGGIIEAFGKEDGPATGTDSRPSRPSGANGAPSQPFRPPSAPPPRPLRDPTPRSIAEVGNRPWADVQPPTPAPPTHATGGQPGPPPPAAAAWPPQPPSTRETGSGG